MSNKIKIPLFPLNLVLLPNEELSLHIFENKYKNMVSDCINNNTDFGIVLKKQTYLNTIGCTAKIVDVLYEYDSGEYDIVVKGNRRFNVLDTQIKDELLLGSATFIKESKKNIDQDLIKSVRNNYLNILLNHKLTKDFDIEIERNTSYDFTKKIILPNKLKEYFLEQKNESERLKFLNDLFIKVIQESNQKKNYDLN